MAPSEKMIPRRRAKMGIMLIISQAALGVKSDMSCMPVCV